MNDDWRSTYEDKVFASDDNWRVPYGVDTAADRALVKEIIRRRKNGEAMTGLTWGVSDDPYHPANNVNHPYYLPETD